MKPSPIQGWFTVIVLVAAACRAAAGLEARPAIVAAVADDTRPESDTTRDADRKPGAVLSFFGIEPGMKVADLMAGGGYYTHLLSRVVGTNGVVYAQNNRTALERFADEQLTARMKQTRFDNVVRLDRELGDLGLPAGELDAVLLILFYHDTYWMKADRPRLNRQVFDALKPGGVYGVIDHAAEAGSGAAHVKDLHRVDAAMVKEEILAAGFVLDGESDLLRHPEDDLRTNVFRPEIRGKTDRFMFRFRKPDG